MRYITLNPSGELAQSGRAPALQAGCQEFESPILHWKSVDFQYAVGSLVVRTGRQCTWSSGSIPDQRYTQHTHRSKL